MEEKTLRYASQEAPMPGDRIKNSTGGLGTVTSITGGLGPAAEPVRISVKWDEGIIEIDYNVATRFTLVSRASKKHGTAGHS